MNLQNLFDNLAHGELSNLAIVNTTTGTIKEAAYLKVVSQINRALRELYKRFLLKKKCGIIRQQAGLTTYYLRDPYAHYVDGSSVNYLSEYDLDEPFNNDVIKVLGVEDPDAKEPRDRMLPLNDPKYPDTGVFTTAFDTIYMVPANPPKRVKITYQAAYPEIKITEDFNPENYELHYPPYIEEALTNYIASLLVKGKLTKASEGEGYASNTFDFKYEAACQRIVVLGLAEEVVATSTQFERRGWI